MSSATEFFCQFIHIDRLFSRAKRPLYLVSFLHQDTCDVDVRQTTEIPYYMRFEMAIVLCFWEKETGYISFLDYR